ncbi:hypothetical protein KKF60_00040 [Patescibacteria group bacterium]|nr:hypothetical protein [Patescibacteria group bacterium]MBU4458292.1 hypothetical protein [Patescibacteria group bacterium]MCG2696207.1 hypothetical protein [Candidatus Portnoybacteria bacterium]
MKNNLESGKISETKLSTEEKCEIQRRLIEEFCEIRKMTNAEQKNICALDWVGKYADNFDQLDKKLIEEYKGACDDEKREYILDKIQKQLENLNKKNG